MALPHPSNISAVVFDYGNTLIEFSRRQIDHCDGALGAALRRLYGDYDVVMYNALREGNRMAPYRNGYRESQLAAITHELVETLYGRSATAAEVEALVETRYTAFVEAIAVEDATHRVLGSLAARYRLGLLSNYPCGRSIRGSLAATGIERHLATVVVSGDLGFVKPHPATYAAILAALDVPPAQVVFVGDNWLADVQGAKRAGMSVVQMCRWVAPEHFEPQPDDFAPDATIGHLNELVPLLGCVV